MNLANEYLVCVIDDDMRIVVKEICYYHESAVNFLKEIPGSFIITRESACE